MIKKGDVALIKSEKALLEIGFTEEAIEKRKEFIGKFVVDTVITNMKFFYIKGDKKYLKWYDDMIIKDTSNNNSKFVEKIKNYCNKYCVFNHSCPKECPLIEIKELLVE